jgi:hypothetical protein
MRMLLTTLAFVLLAACANSFSGDGGGIVLANRTDHALLYAAFGLADAALVDPNPAIDPAQAPERRVPAGEQRTLQVSGDPAEGVVLFLYDIPPGHAGPVPLSRTVRVTAEELRQMQNRIAIGPE